MKRAEGSVMKTDGGYFARLRYTDAAGKAREKKRKFRTHKAANTSISELRYEIERERAGRRTYRDLDTLFRKDHLHEARFAGDNKISGFRQDLRKIERYLDRALEHFGDREIEAIEYADLKEYKTKIASWPVERKSRKTQRSISSINHHLKWLRRLFNIGIEAGWLTQSPFKRGGSLITESIEVNRTRMLSWSEETALLDACDPWRRHIRPLIIFAVETGLRRGEIQTLRWSSVDLEKRCVNVESRNSKTLRFRLVPLTARAVETLAKLRQNSANRGSAPVFGSSDFKKAFNGACADAGLDDVHFHDLRHTAITRMLEKGISPPLVMKISGHTQQKTFMRYVNQTESSIYDIAMKLDQAGFDHGKQSLRAATAR